MAAISRAVGWLGSLLPEEMRNAGLEEGLGLLALYTVCTSTLGLSMGRIILYLCDPTTAKASDLIIPISVVAIAGCVFSRDPDQPARSDNEILFSYLKRAVIYLAGGVATGLSMGEIVLVCDGDFVDRLISAGVLTIAAYCLGQNAKTSFNRQQGLV